MKSRRSHYELAFEAYLDRRGTAYVAVEDVHHFGAKDTGVKAFDYIVYPAGTKACLVDEKGGYPSAIGHLFEAEDESQAWPELHDTIREARRAY